MSTHSALLGRTGHWLAVGLVFSAVALPPRMPAAQAASGPERLARCLVEIRRLLEPPAGQPAPFVSTTLRCTQAHGWPAWLDQQELKLAFQAPDKMRLGLRVEERRFELGRQGDTLWITAPHKAFGVVGAPEVPRFGHRADSVLPVELPPLRLPLPARQWLLLPAACQIDSLPSDSVDGTACEVVELRPRPHNPLGLHLPFQRCRLWLRESDSLPVKCRIEVGDGRLLEIELAGLAVAAEPPPAAFEPDLPQTALTRVALAHLTRFFPAALSILEARNAPSVPARPGRRLLAEVGRGRLEEQDGLKVLFLRGSPEEMGRQHGQLLGPQVRDLVGKVLYGVGVGSSFEKGRWFFQEIEECQARIEPFIPQAYLREMDALAAATGLDPHEIRLANFFPELFHCSGFAVWGDGTADGRLYHGRVLDYMRGIGLEPNAVLVVHQPQEGYAWVNVSYAGFVGSVTAMNEHGISIGEMGGRGEGQWDGKPMAQLVREVMERAASLEEALRIFRESRRTCEYYYVLASGRERRAVGIAATPDTFQVVKGGQYHPLLPHPVPDAVILSAGDRYETLVARVMEQYGRLDAETAWRLMDRPVAMTSNIHCALFAPETLDLWVAHATPQAVAAHVRHIHFNLRELLDRPSGRVTPTASAEDR